MAEKKRSAGAKATRDERRKVPGGSPRKTAGGSPRKTAGGSAGKAAPGSPRKTGRAAVRASSAPCAVFDRCGACETLNVPYSKQLSAKQRLVGELFAKLAAPEAFRPILGMSEPFHYRNKVVSPYAPGRKLPARGGTGTRREVLTGMYAKGTHRLIPTDECLLENATAKAVTLAVRDLMRRWDIPPYDEDAHVGFMRHAVVRVGHASGEVLVTLVTNNEEFPSSKSFCRELVRRVPAVTTVVQNVNMRRTNVILGEQERVLYGPGFILDTLCGLSFRISSRSFYQVNSTQTEVLYNTAVELAGLRGAETVVDAYCGTGTIGLVAASRGARRVIGVDNVESAIRDARENARHNGIANAEFIAADAADFMRDLARERNLSPSPDRGVGNRRDEETPVGTGLCPVRSGGRDAQPEGISQVEQQANRLILMMDPPRAGASEEFLRAAARLAPDRIVYISCNPRTQARDAAFLIRAGYELHAIQPVDMFPHTNHVECVALFERTGGLSAKRDG